MKYMSMDDLWEMIENSPSGEKNKAFDLLREPRKTFEEAVEEAKKNFIVSVASVMGCKNQQSLEEFYRDCYKYPQNLGLTFSEYVEKCMNDNNFVMAYQKHCLGVYNTYVREKKCLVDNLGFACYCDENETVNN